MVDTMAKSSRKAGVPAPRADDDTVTTVKCYRRLARVITQIASLRGQNQQDILDGYAKQLEDDLLTELANRQSELRGNRRS